MERKETLAGTEITRGHGQCGGEGKLLRVRITLQECSVCVWAGGFGSRRCRLPNSSQNTQNTGNISLYLEFLDSFPASTNVSKMGIQTGVMSEIPASCKVHLLVAALLIRLTHLCVKTDGRQRKHANVTSVTCKSAAVTQLWAECSRTSTGFLQRSKSVVTSTQQPTYSQCD